MSKAPTEYDATASLDPSYIPMYQPMSKSGKRLLKPRPKPYDQWTPEEWARYDAHISEVRSRAGRLGGVASARKINTRGRSKLVSVACRAPDYAVISAYAKLRDVSVAELFHEMAEQIREAMPDLGETTATPASDATQA